MPYTNLGLIGERAMQAVGIAVIIFMLGSLPSLMLWYVLGPEYALFSGILGTSLTAGWVYTGTLLRGA